MYEHDVTRNAHSDPVNELQRKLDALIHRFVVDLKVLVEEESYPFQQARRYVAEWHLNYLFQSPDAKLGSQTQSSKGTSGQKNSQEKALQVRTILCHTSRILEKLADASGTHSFMVAVDPNDSSDQGFLGGSVRGREYWRGMRNGGAAGAKAFKLHCQKANELVIPASGTIQMSQIEQAPPQKTGNAKEVKQELYEATRNALRTASGVRNAEMKWTHPERLDVYGVRLSGWPEDVPTANPSGLKTSQNKKLLQLLQCGVLCFKPIVEINEGTSPPDTDAALEQMVDTTQYNDELQYPPEGEVEEDFSWAYDINGGADPDDEVEPEGRPELDETEVLEAPIYPVNIRSSSEFESRGMNNSRRKRPRTEESDTED